MNKEQWRYCQKSARRNIKERVQKSLADEWLRAEHLKYIKPGGENTMAATSDDGLVVAPKPREDQRKEIEIGDQIELDGLHIGIVIAEDNLIWEIDFKGAGKHNISKDDRRTFRIINKKEHPKPIIDDESMKKFNKMEDNKGLTETMGKLLAQVVMPLKDKKAVLQALVQEDKTKREKLFVEWGFDATFEKGKGLIFLFWGPPGTGKTMCAQGIAQHLGRKYLILGSAEIQSPIPGQAERNVKEAFSRATKDKLVIVLDECDSLLYNRNQVGAIMGAEINCLLSEIERFEGVCVLTTNRSVLLDPALERRIALKLEFKHPDAKMRAYIWDKLIPSKCPLGKCVDIKKLAKAYDLPGGNIKNAILSAARSAVYANKDKVEMEDFLAALDKEYEGQDAFKSKGVAKKDIGRLVDRLFDMGGSRDLGELTKNRIAETNGAHTPGG